MCFFIPFGVLYSALHVSHLNTGDVFFDFVSSILDSCIFDVFVGRRFMTNKFFHLKTMSIHNCAPCAKSFKTKKAFVSHMVSFAHKLAAKEIDAYPICDICDAVITTTIEQHEKTMIHKLVESKIGSSSGSCCTCKINKINKYEFDDEQITEFFSGRSVSVRLPDQDLSVYPIDRIINPTKADTKFKMVVDGKLINNSKECSIVYDSFADLYKESKSNLPVKYNIKANFLFIERVCDEIDSPRIEIFTNHGKFEYANNNETT